MLKFGILGIGQGGTNIAEYAFTKGFKAVIANTAQVDLDQAEYIPGDCKIHLGGMGAGRDRQLGIQAMVQSADRVLEKCQQEFANCDAVFVAATGGGGTGSGGLPVGLEILMSFHKYVGAIVVLPDDMESPKAKMNTLECFSQMSDFENLGSVFIIDNQKARDANPTLGRKSVYNTTNKEIIDRLCELNALTDQPSYVANFDACDFLSIIQERGYSMVSRSDFYTSDDESKFEVAKRIRESWQKANQPMFNDGQILKAAILGKITERLASRVDTNLIFQETGVPYDFTDVYFPPETSTFDKLSGKSKAVFYTIFSGLAFPEKRLGVINGTLKLIEERLTNNFQKSQTQKFEADSWNSKFSAGRVVSIGNNAIKSEKPGKIDLSSKLTKFR